MNKINSLIGKNFIVTKEWQVKNSKMKVGDILKIIDYDYGSVSDYFLFTNDRLPKYIFGTEVWSFKRNTQQENKVPA